MAKKVPAYMQDKQKSYYKYYATDIYAGEKETYDMIPDKPLDNSIAHRIQNRNDLFKPGYLPGEFGWWILEDGTGLVANKTFLPGVTGEMFDWWFAWHPMDRLRYACWDNEDHYDVYLDDPAKARDLTKSMRERHWGSVHHVWEDTGLGADLLNLYFLRPGDMGFDESKLDSDVCSTIVCANGFTVGNDQMPDVPAVMTHFLRPVEGGSELRSRFWFGYSIIDKEPVKLLPEGISIPEIVPKSLLNHNVKEFSNLSKILPSLYAEEKDNWFD